METFVIVVLIRRPSSRRCALHRGPHRVRLSDAVWPARGDLRRRRHDRPGLHFKWPWPIQSVQRLDRRLQYFDLPGAELLTRDPQRNTIDRTLTIDAYVCWRIADAPRRGPVHPQRGHARRGAGHSRSAHLPANSGAAIGEMELDDLISPDPARRWTTRGKQLRKRLLQGSGTSSPSLQAVAESEYGIEVVDVRLRRSNHPPAVREAIFERIRSEREQEGGRLPKRRRAAGADIKSDGDRRVDDPQGGGGSDDRGTLKEQAEGRGRPHPQRRPKQRPAVLYLPQETGRISAHSRRQQEHAAALDAPRNVRHAIQPPDSPETNSHRPYGTPDGRKRRKDNIKSQIISSSFVFFRVFRVSVVNR